MFAVMCPIDWSPRWRNLFWAGMTILILALAVDYASKASREASAIVRWRGLIQHLVRGNNVYNEPGLGGSFPNPPLAGILLWPFAAMPPVVGALSLFALKVVLAGVALYWSIRLATADEFRLPGPSLIVLLVLVSRPLLSDLAHGNINIVVLFLTVAGLWALRRRRDGAAGMLIALATAIKLTPALFIPYFAFKRQWRVVAASVVGLLIFLFVVPGLFLGFERNLWLLQSWAGAMIWPYLLDGKVETLQVNQSLPGIWFRLVTDCPGVKLGDDSLSPVNFLSMDHRAALWLLKLLIIALLAWVGWLSRASRERCDWRLACEFALVYIAMLLISERSWKHHFVTMALPYATMVAQLVRPTSRAIERGFLRVALVAAFLLMASTSSELGGLVLGDEGHKFAQAYGMFAGSAIICLCAISAILSSSPRGTTTAAPETEGRHAFAVA